MKLEKYILCVYMLTLELASPCAKKAIEVKEEFILDFFRLSTSIAIGALASALASAFDKERPSFLLEL